MIIHHSFDEPDTFERQKAYPSRRPRSWDWQVGFIGVMYLRGTEYQGVDARGVLGLDEFKYNIPS